jgi:NTE family protein
MATRSKGKTALVLASGGVAGVSYEVGALRALDHILNNRTVNDFDIYVGTSAGSIVSASLASGVPPVMLAGLIAGTVPGFGRLGRGQLFRPNFAELATRLTWAPALIRQAAAEYWRFRDRMPISEALYALAPLLPSGIFTNTGLESFLRQTLAQAGLSDDFRDVPKELHIIAADIETDRRVTFSKITSPEVPISRAVAASTCIPVLFKPVEINGHHYVDGGIKGHAAVDVAINRGARLIVVVNALVPLDTEAIKNKATVDIERESITDLGIRAIYNQVMRGMMHDSLVDHLRAVRERHPEVDIVLIEPQPDDEKMFFHEVMSFSAQLIVMQHGYESVASGLSRSWSYLQRILPEHGIEITRKVIDRKPLHVPVAEMKAQRTIFGRLRQTVLDRRTEPRDLEPEIKPPAARVKSQRKRTPRKAAAKSSGAFKPRVISSEAKEA